MKLGYADGGIPIIWDINAKVTKNNLMLCLGMSGYGKTTLARNIIREGVSENIPVIVIDYSGSYRKDEIEELGGIEYHNVFLEGLKINIFKPRENSIDGIYVKENYEQIADRICELLINAFKLTGNSQKFELRAAILETLENNTLTFEALVSALLSKKTTASKGLAIKISALKFLDSGTGEINPADAIKKRKTVVYQFSDYNEPVRTLLIELFLLDLWEFTKKIGNKDNFLIILDEIQNLSFTGNSFLSRLREFRKYGIGTVMITQFLGQSFKADARELLEQSDLRIYFKPNPKNITSVAKSIDVNKYKHWYGVLETLDVGECIFCGPIKVGDRSVGQKVLMQVPEN